MNSLLTRQPLTEPSRTADSFWSKRPFLKRSLLFLLILALLLSVLSQLSIQLGRSRNPLFNASARDLLDQPKNSIDVLVIGTSDVYSAVSPMEWWTQYGYAGFAWGEAAQRVYETHEYLKKIYRVQSPKVVFLEVGDLYRDQTDAQNLDSMAKAYIADVFPIVTYHRNLAPERFLNLMAKPHALTKGYLLRLGTMKPSGSCDSYMKTDDSFASFNPLSGRELKQCIELCRSHGSSVVLLSIPSYTDWNMQKHNSVAELAEGEQVPYLDLNLALQQQIDWNTDSADGGKHLNFRGAEKVSDYLGNYLRERYVLPDHQSDVAYSAWQSDGQDYEKEMNSLRQSA